MKILSCIVYVSCFLFCCLLAAIAILAQENKQDIYVANAGTFTLDKVSTKGKGGISTISLFTEAPFDIVVTSDGQIAYTSLPNNNTVEVSDIETGSGASIVTGFSPTKMVMNENETRLYVATSTNVTTIDITLQPDGTRTNTEVPAENIELASIFIGNGTSVAVVGSFLAVGTDFGEVGLFDVSSPPPILLATRSTGSRIQDLEFHPGGTLLYVALGSYRNGVDENGNTTQSGNLHVLRVSTLELRSVARMGFAELQNIALVNGLYLYGTNITGELLSFELATDQLLNTLIVGIQLFGISATNSKIYVTNPAEDLVQIVRLGRTPDRDRVAKKSISLPGGSTPFGIAVLP